MGGGRGGVDHLNPVTSTVHCCRSHSELLYFSPAGRLGLECEDDFSSPMQVSFAPGPGIFFFYLSSRNCPLNSLRLFKICVFCFWGLLICAGGGP